MIMREKSFKPISVFESNRKDMIKSRSVLPLVTLISSLFFDVIKETSKIQIFWCQQIARNTLHKTKVSRNYHMPCTCNDRLKIQS